ncbi:hypothetical protein A3863_07900 [Priestia endophytica]|uniref:hypothetical protein n=1 Tax=Priestia endophytica TaxID=135735 RepID=UPI000DCA74A5|nr:hypothetical protein [Priestia endophytica]RAS90778.1 hypothetical protein A3863_07875 [Priestia endophytica]RAS90783.1 hypothetical protein A3863_07900 [Priestia endophytica]
MWEIIEKPVLTDAEKEQLVEDMKFEEFNDDVDYETSIKYVTFTVDKAERIINMTGHFSKTWKYVVKREVYGKFLKLNPDFFSVSDICDLLKITRRPVEMLIKEGILRTYKVLIHNETSNFKLVIHKSDLFSGLKKLTKRNMDRTVTFSNYSIPEKEDVFNRKNALGKKEMKQMYVLEHMQDEEAVNEILKKIVNRDSGLESRKTLKEHLGKSETTIARLARCLPTIHFVLSGTGTRENTRIILPGQIEQNMGYLLHTIKLLSSNAVIPLDIKVNKVPQVKLKELDNAYDFLELYYLKGIQQPTYTVLYDGKPVLVNTSKSKSDQT